jgi:hypothetical protein
MAGWESADRVQKNDSGEYRALINGEWIPVDRAQKNESGEYRIMRGEGNYLVEAAIKGFSSGASMVESFARNAPAAIARPFIKPFVDTKTLSEIGSEYSQQKERNMGIMGSTGAEPENAMQKMLATGVEFAADPTNLLFPVSGAVKNVAGRAGLSAVESFAAGFGSEAGKEAVGHLGEKIGYQEAGEIAGMLIGGMGASVTAGNIQRIGLGIKKVGPKIKSLFANKTNPHITEKAQAYAAKSIENVWIAAAATDPKFFQKIEEAQAAAKALGVEMPISAIMADNPVINAYISNLASTNPEFKARFFSKYEDAKNVLRKSASKTFGDPTKADDILENISKTIDPSWVNPNKAHPIEKTVSRKLSSLDAKAKKDIDSLKDIDAYDFGSKVTKLTKDARSIAAGETSPLYKAAFKYADNAGVELPSSAVEDIYKLTVGETNADIFKTFPSLEAKIKKYFSPKAIKTAQTFKFKGAERIARDQKTIGREFSSASIEHLDSLKREVNRSLRTATSGSDIRVLGNLKDRLNVHISNLDEGFVSLYKKADEVYLNKIGLPFNEATIKDIGRAKFNENVVNTLTKNKSALIQFTNVTGKPGEKLAEDAFFSSLRSHIDAGRSIKSWQLKHKDTLTFMPKVQEEVRRIAKDSSILNRRMSAINKSFSAIEAKQILKIEGVSANDIVNNLYKSPKYLSKFMAQHGNSKDKLNAVRSFMLDNVMTHENPIEILQDKTKQRVFDKVFGTAYAKRIRDIALLSQRLKKDPAKVAPHLTKIREDVFKAMSGTSPERVYSLFMTNPVVSKQVAFATIAKNFFNKKGSDLADQQMIEILLDPEKAVLLSKSLKSKSDALSMEMAGKLSKKLGVSLKDIIVSMMKKQVSSAKTGAAKVGKDLLGTEVEETYPPLEIEIITDYRGQ